MRYVLHVLHALLELLIVCSEVSMFSLVCLSLSVCVHLSVCLSEGNRISSDVPNIVFGLSSASNILNLYSAEQ